MDSVVHAVAARRILTSRASSFVVTDPDRAQRIIAQQLHWLHRLDADSRSACLTEVAAALAGGDLEAVLTRWHPDRVLVDA